MSIQIGDKNRIQNSVIAEHYNETERKNPVHQKKRLIERHPYIVSLLISLFAGFILLFPFWSRIVSFIVDRL